MSFDFLSGDDGEEVTPVPIPNTEVKLFSADGSWGIAPARVGRCQAVYTIFYTLGWSNEQNIIDIATSNPDAPNFPE